MPKDKNKVEIARHEFSKKDFKNCLAIYKTINSDLLNELDRKIIQYCEFQAAKN